MQEISVNKKSTAKPDWVHAGRFKNRTSLLITTILIL